MARPREAGVGRALTGAGLVAVIVAIVLLAWSLGVLPGERLRVAQTYQAVQRQMTSSGVGATGDDVQAAQANLSVASVRGGSYVGTVEVPSLDLRLAVDAGGQGDTLARGAATLWQGSPTTGHLVLAGEDSPTVFGQLQTLTDGALVSFATMEGARFDYRVVSAEVVDRQEDSDLAEGDLVLFAPTFSGGGRVVVRCYRA